MSGLATLGSTRMPPALTFLRLDLGPSGTPHRRGGCAGRRRSVALSARTCRRDSNSRRGARGTCPVQDLRDPQQLRQDMPHTNPGTIPTHCHASDTVPSHYTAGGPSMSLQPFQVAQDSTPASTVPFTVVRYSGATSAF